MCYLVILFDGELIVFFYCGDLWIVLSEGGMVCLFIIYVDYEWLLIWLFDGLEIVFVLDWYGNFDIFIVFFVGGVVWWLIYYFVNDVFNFFILDGKLIFFLSCRIDVF